MFKQFMELKQYIDGILENYLYKQNKSIINYYE